MEKESKRCKRCHQSKSIDNFPASALSKDGKLGFCMACWKRKTSEAWHNTKAERLSGKKKATSRSRPSASAPPLATGNMSVSFGAANEALAAAAASSDRFMVVNSKGDSLEFDNERQALNKALEFKMNGLDVKIWRQCEFEMILRIIG